MGINGKTYNTPHFNAYKSGAESGAGKYQEYHEKWTYDDELAPETSNNIDQHTIANLVQELGLPVETIETIQEWSDQQISLGVREFVRAFVQRLSHSLHGFCVLRALGYHAHIEANGVRVQSLRQIAKHFKCSHQYVDRLTKDLEQQLGVVMPSKSVEIEKKNYTMHITPPKGWLTYGQAMEYFKITRKRLLRVIKTNQLQVRSYKRGSKLVNIKEVTKALAEN